MILLDQSNLDIVCHKYYSGRMTVRVDFVTFNLHKQAEQYRSRKVSRSFRFIIGELSIQYSKQEEDNGRFKRFCDPY